MTVPAPPAGPAARRASPSGWPRAPGGATPARRCSAVPRSGMLRLAPAARGLLAGDRLVVTRRPHRGARRPAARRRRRRPRPPARGVPRGHRGGPGEGPARTGSPGCSPRCAPTRGRRGARSWWSTTVPRNRRRWPPWPPRTGPDWSVTPSARGPAAARNAGLAGGRHRPGRLRRLRLRAGAPAGWSGWPRTWPTRGWPLVAPRITALPGRPAGLGRRATSRCAAPWTWARCRPGSRRSPPSPTCRAPRCSPGGPRWAPASTRRCGSPRTSTWSGG